MILDVPRRRQPDGVTCLPTCVWCVLTFQGYRVDLDDVIEACRLDTLGASDELALQSLREQWDIDEVREFDRSSIRDALDDSRPLILTYEVGEVGLHSLGHAVVICGATDDAIVVMDPLFGDYQTIPWEDAETRFGTGFNRGFFIAGGLKR